MRTIGRHSLAAALLCLTPILASTGTCQNTPAGMSSNTRAEVHGMLRDAYEHLSRDYYDPTFHGVDLAAKYALYNAQLDKVQSLGQGFGLVTSFCNELRDSHVFFEPPSRPVVVESGYLMTAIGDVPYITGLRPGSDAAAKLHLGDTVLQFDGFHPTRAGLFGMERYFHVLAPSTEDHLKVQGPGGGEPQQVVVKSIVQQKKRLLEVTDEGEGDYQELVRQGLRDETKNRQRLYESGDLLVWKMSRFFFGVDDLNKIMGRAAKHGTLVIDLRDNGGGSVDSLELLVGRLFDHDVKIADLVSRKPSKPMIAKHWSHSYAGKLIILTNSNSASASELLARVVQLEKRGTVLGDRSAGAVMESRSTSDSQGADTKIFYGFSITVANLLMTDGKSLEGIGVTPDQPLLPTADDLAAGRDPVLAEAFAQGGAKLDPAQAGKLFPYEWNDLL